MKLRLTLDHGVSLSDIEHALGRAGFSLAETLDPGLRIVREIPEHLRARAQRELAESEVVPFILQQQAG